MEDSTPYLALLWCSKIFCNDLWQQNILYYTYITKSFKTHSAQAFSQLKVLVYADICIYIVCMKACTYMHNLILNYGAFDIWVQKWTSTVATCIHICILYKNNNTLLTTQSLCIRKDVNIDLEFFLFSLTWLKPNSLVFLHREAQTRGLIQLDPYSSLLSYTAALQPSVLYLSSSVCLTVLSVNLIYGLVAYVMTVLHIIAELKKTEKWTVLVSFSKKATEIISGNTTKKPPYKKATKIHSVSQWLQINKYWQRHQLLQACLFYKYR